MNPYEIERTLINHVVTFGNEAALLCLPQLTQDKFVFSYHGQFGMGHSLIWQAIRHAYLKDNLSPITDVLVKYLDSTEVDYLRQLPLIPNLDPTFVEQLATLVDKQGIVYNVAKNGHALGQAINSVETFMQTVDNIPDIEAWSTDQLTRIRQNISIQSEGYKHISDIADRLETRWQDIMDSKFTPVLECGIPILKQNKLFPRGEMVVVHGLSGSGKSTFVFTVNLGVAIHLYLTGQPGCVAVNSLEMTGLSLVERLAGILAHVDVSAFRIGKVSPTDHAKLVEQLGFVRKLPIFIDDTNFLTTTAMQYRASGLHVSQHGPVVQLSSDYGELFKDNDGASEEQRVNKVFREQLQLSRLIDASVIAISQSTNDRSVSGKTYIAGPDGTRYSKGILQAADGLCELYNPSQIDKSGRDVVLKGSVLEKTLAYFIVQKYRGAEVGEFIPFGWRPETTTFFDRTMTQTMGKETVFSHYKDAWNKYKGQGSW